MLLLDDKGYLGKVNKSHFGQIFGDVSGFFSFGTEGYSVVFVCVNDCKFMLYYS
jgi:hypothetical protein